MNVFLLSVQTRLLSVFTIIDPTSGGHKESAAFFCVPRTCAQGRHELNNEQVPKKAS